MQRGPFRIATAALPYEERACTMRALGKAWTMGSKLRWATAIVGTVAMLAGAVAPAQARDRHYPGYGYGNPGGWGWGGSPYRYRPYRHYDRGLDAGDVIGIAALIGAVAVIASAASKDRKTSRYPDADSRDLPADDGRNGDYRGGDYRDDGYADGPSGAAMGEEEAVNACVAAARDRAESERGGYAEVRGVDPARATGKDGWAIDGRVELRRNYQDQSGETRRFSCDVKDGRVASVSISRDAV